MSVKELIIGEGSIKVKFTTGNEKFYATLFDHKTIGGIVLDRNQAHLLMMYLQEHLGYNKVPSLLIQLIF